MSIQGTWKNAYHSQLTLVEEPNGFVYGTYGSTTGSVGTYLVCGWIEEQQLPPNGQAMGLSLFWRSTEGDADPSWHWVSGFGGQYLQVEGVPQLVLVHDLVATADFPTVAGLGSYLDKLVYVQTTPAPPPPPMPAAEPADDPVNGTWACAAAGIQFDVSVQNAPYGVVTGTWSGGEAIVGFTDTYAASCGLARQGVTLAVRLGTQVTTLSGWLDLTAGTMTLLQMQNSPTAPANAWLQTNAVQLTFTRT